MDISEEQDRAYYDSLEKDMEKDFQEQLAEIMRIEKEEKEQIKKNELAKMEEIKKNQLAKEKEKNQRIIEWENLKQSAISEIAALNREIGRKNIKVSMDDHTMNYFD